MRGLTPNPSPEGEGSNHAHNLNNRSIKVLLTPAPLGEGGDEALGGMSECYNRIKNLQGKSSTILYYPLSIIPNYKYVPIINAITISPFS